MKSLGLPRTGTETKVQVRVYLGGNSGKVPIGGIGGSEKRKRRKPIKGALLSTMGNGRDPLGVSAEHTL